MRLLANEANGSARDSLSLLELLSNSLNKKISYDKSILKLGIAPKEVVQSISVEILSGNIKESLEILAQICEKGYDIKKFILSILFFYRSLIYSKLEINSNDSTIELIDNELNSKFETISIHEVENIFDNLINSYQDISKSTNLRISAETAIIKLCLIGDFVNFDTKLPEESKKKVKNSDINFKKDIKNSVNGEIHIKNDIDQDTKLIPEKPSELLSDKETTFNLKENKDRLFESQSMKSLFETFDCRILEIEKEN